MSTLFPDGDSSTPSYHGPTDEEIASMHRGTNWFYWIAGLSLINTAIYHFGGQVSFIIGLAYTQIVDAIAGEMIADGGPELLRWMAIGFDVMVLAFFALIGYFANKGSKGAFLAGIVVYVIDALLWLMFEGWFQIAFHVFALFGIAKGFMACREIGKFAKAA